MKFFIYDDVSGEVAINEIEILLIKEFATLYDVKRNKTKADTTGKQRTRAFKEFKYIYLYIDWQSPYSKYSEQDKHKEALLDSGLTDSEFNDADFQAACAKYEEIQDSNLSIKLLKAAQRTVFSLIEYLSNVDISERNPVDGKPIFKTKDVIAEIKGSKDVISSLKALEEQVKSEVDADTSLRGGAEAGMFDK